MLKAIRRLLGEKLLYTPLAKIAIFAIFIAFGFQVQASLSCEDVFISKKLDVHDLKKQPVLNPTKSELLENIWLVHATNYYPDNGVVSAGFSSSGTKKESAVFRPAIHFAAGELVLSHSLGNWEKSKIAVILPIKSVHKRIYSFIPQDISVMGDITLPSEAVVLVPEGFIVETLSATHKIKIYNPDITSLRDAVDKALIEVGAWRFRAEGGNVDDRIFFNNREINPKKFFSPLIKITPAGFQLHGETLLGSFDGFTQSYFIGLKEGSGYARNTLASRFELTHLQQYFDAAKAELEKISLSHAESAGVARNIKHIEDFITLLTAEHWARINFKKTLSDVNNSSLLASFFSLRGQPEKLKKFLMDNSDKLNVIPDKEDIFLEDLINGATSMDQIKMIITEQPELINVVGGWPAIRALWQMHIRFKLNTSYYKNEHGQLRHELISDYDFIRNLNLALSQNKKQIYNLGGMFLGFYNTPKKRKNFTQLSDWKELKNQLESVFGPIK